MDHNNDPKQDPLPREDEYYFENGLMVLKSNYLKRRGYCCNNGCRHCPYPQKTDS